MKTIKEWLDELYYVIGKQQYNFYVSGMKKKLDGDVISTKWKTYLETVSEVDIGEHWKLNWINQRQILPNEIVLDLEEENQLTPIIKDLKDMNETFYVFSTGSRGYHVNIFFNEEFTLKEKETIIDYFGADPQKASKKTMIALEYVRHWKSGEIKREVLRYEC